jgi:hypothetical protein
MMLWLLTIFPSNDLMGDRASARGRPLAANCTSERRSCRLNDDA